VAVPRRREVSNAQIVRAARKVFLAHGTQAPVSLVAKELGVSPATLFVRMGTKSKLISAALWPPDPAVLETLQSGRIGTEPVAAQLLAIVSELAVHAEAEIPATFTLYAAGLRAKPSDDFSDVTPARLRRALTRWLRDAVRAGIVECDPRMAAEVILGTLEARAMHAFLGKRAISARETREFARGLIATVLAIEPSRTK
jgi:AcrR family transcriptional regulator